MTAPQGRTPEGLMKRGSIMQREWKESATQQVWRLTVMLSEWSTDCDLPAGDSGPHDFCVPAVLLYVSKVTCKLVENVNLSRELEINCHVHCVKPNTQSRT